MWEIWKWANLTLAFGLELVALAVLALWGWKSANATAVQIVSAGGIPLLAALVWGLFAAPNATFDQPVLAVLTKVAVFGGASVGLWAMGYRTASVVFVAVLVANLLAIRLGHLTV